MPRQPVVPHSEIRKAILDQDVVSSDGVVHGPSHNVWKSVQKALGDKVTANYMYVYVKEDRKGILTEILCGMGLARQAINSSEEEEEDSEEDSQEECDDIRKTKELQPVKTFNVLIPPKKWEDVKPVPTPTYRADRPTKQRTRLTLPPFKWEPVIVDLLWSQHKLPCPYSFQHGTVYSSSSRECFVKITATCKECGASGTGTILTEPPDNEEVILKWSANDTRNVPHKLKRFLSHNLRADVGEKLQGRSAAEYRRKEAQKTMDHGDVEPPNLYSKQVLRKAKQWSMDRELKICPSSTDPIKNLQIMKHTEPYAGSIHQIGTDPFFVFYHSPAQLHVFQKFASAEYIVLALDATGSVVLRLITPSGRSPHIFLYEGVIKAGTEQLPVFQMLSSRQDAGIIKFWIDEFIRQGAPQPNEVVMDNSKALINAAVMTFCGCYSLRDYFERCFYILNGAEDTEHVLPQCFLRLDIAHLFGGASKWKEWKNKATRRLKLFYLQCLGLLALETTLESFYTTFTRVGLAASSEFSDRQISSAVSNLIQRIEGTPLEVKELIDAGVSDAQEDGDPDDPNEEEEDYFGETVLEFTQKIKDDIKSGSTKAKQGSPNPYYAPEILSRFYYLLPDFLLWTALMVDSFKSPTLTGSSARVESDFGILKKGILAGTAKPLRLDKVVAKHLVSIEGSCHLAYASGRKTSSRNFDDNEGSGRDHEECDSSIDDPGESSGTSDLEEGRKSVGQKKRKIDDQNSSAKDLEVSDGNDNYEEYSVTSDFEEVINLEVTKNLRGEKKKKNNDPEISASSGHDAQQTEKRNLLNETENWRGQGMPKKSKTSKYLNTNPELSLVLNADSLQPPKNRLLENGLRKGFVKTSENSKVHLKNTCGFDVIVQLLTNGYIQYGFYREEIEEFMERRDTEHDLLKTCKSLALNGAVRETYMLRVETLSKITPPSTVVGPGKSSTRKRKSSVGITYDCFSDMVDISRSLLGDLYSAKVTFKCSLRSYRPCTPNEEHTVINADIDVIREEGIKMVGKAILVSLSMMDSTSEDVPTEDVRGNIGCPSPCTGMMTVACKFGLHLIVNVDQFGGTKTTIKIEDVPAHLTLLGVDFVLFGIAARKQGHYLAYARRAGGHWEVFNDLATTVKVAKPNTAVEPVLLMYAKVVSR